MSPELHADTYLMHHRFEPVLSTNLPFSHLRGLVAVNPFVGVQKDDSS